MKACQPTVTGPRGEAYQRRTLEKLLRKAYGHAGQLPPTEESSAIRQGVDAALSAVWAAQRKYGEE